MDSLIERMPDSVARVALEAQLSGLREELHAKELRLNALTSALERALGVLDRVEYWDETPHTILHDTRAILREAEKRDAWLSDHS